MQPMRKFTAGVQLFDNIRERGMIYVDKTEGRHLRDAL